MALGLRGLSSLANVTHGPEGHWKLRWWSEAEPPDRVRKEQSAQAGAGVTTSRALSGLCRRGGRFPRALPRAGLLRAVGPDTPPFLPPSRDAHKCMIPSFRINRTPWWQRGAEKQFPTLSTRQLNGLHRVLNLTLNHNLNLRGQND